LHKAVSDLASLDPRYVEYGKGDLDARLLITVSVQGEDVKRLERIAEARGTTPGDVVAELLRDADQSAA